MKTKNEKSPRALLPVNPLLDGQVDDFTNTRQSWLDRSLGLDLETPRSQKRAIVAELFLQTRLFPRVEASQPLDEQVLADLLVDFNGSRAAGKVELETAQIAVRLLSRFQCYLLDDDDEDASLLARSGALERELELFTSLVALDFQRIDQAVRKRLHSS